MLSGHLLDFFFWFACLFVLVLYEYSIIHDTHLHLLPEKWKRCFDLMFSNQCFIIQAAMFLFVNRFSNSMKLKHT